MNLFDQMRSWTIKAVKETRGALSFIPAWVRTAWMDISFRNLVQGGYKSSSAVFACVRALTFSFPEPPMIVYEQTVNGEQPVASNHPLQQLIRKPNDDMGEAELMQFVITYAAIGGNIYLWKERNAGGRVIALWPFSDGDMSPIPGHSTSEGIVGGYEFDPGDGNKITLAKRDVIHWKWMIDPDQPWRGMGAIAAAVKDVSSDTESSRYMYALLKNDAIPRVAVTLVPGDELTDAKAKRLRAAWKSKYGGENAGEIAFLEAGMTIQKLGLNMQELDIAALKDIPESRICASFGVPPVIAGLSVGLKRSDYGDGQARKSFTETTLVALWRNFASEMQNGLADEFGGGLAMRFDLIQVRALQENMNELWSRIDKAVAGGYLTRAEARRALGYTVTSADNVYRESLVGSWEPATGGSKTINKTVTKALFQNGEGSIHEAKTAFAAYGRSLQRIRKSLAPRMADDLDGYFSSLADRVVSRAGKALQMMIEKKADLPGIDDLLTPKDVTDLEKVLKRWYVSIIEASWETINLSLGIKVAFDVNDPTVTAALAKAGGLIRGTAKHPENEITDTIREQLRDALKYGNENGWSIQQLVRGDENQPGIRSIVEETYKNRVQTIARTELGNAQNAATSERYQANGVDNVGILDNGNEDDDDDECKVANGQVWTREYFDSHPLEHPNCTRCAYPIFENVTPDRS